MAGGEDIQGQVGQPLQIRPCGTDSSVSNGLSLLCRRTVASKATTTRVVRTLSAPPYRLLCSISTSISSSSILHICHAIRIKEHPHTLLNVHHCNHLAVISSVSSIVTIGSSSRSPHRHPPPSSSRPQDQNSRNIISVIWAMGAGAIPSANGLVLRQRSSSSACSGAGT
ncbi:hypothetical protein Tco_0552895 [Tanacetum coccineum]